MAVAPTAGASVFIWAWDKDSSLIRNRFHWTVLLTGVFSLVGCASSSYRTYPVRSNAPPSVLVGEVIGFRDSGYTRHSEFLAVEILVSDWVLGGKSDTVLAVPRARAFLNYFGRLGISTQSSAESQQWFQVGDKLVAVAFPRKQDPLYINLPFVRFFTESPGDSLQPVYWTRKASFDRVLALEPRPSLTSEEIYGLVDRSWEQDEMNLGELVQDIHHFYTERLRWRLTRSIWKRKPWRGNWDPDRGIVP